MVVLGIGNAVNDNSLSAVGDGLVLLEEVKDFVHEPWDDLLVHCSLSGWHQHALSAQLLHSVLA